MTRIVASIALALWSLSGTAQQPTPQLTPQDRSIFPLTTAVAFGGNDRWVVQGDFDRLRIFDVASGRLLRTITVASGLTGRFQYTPAFAAHPTKDLIFWCTRDGSLVALDPIRTDERWRSPLYDTPLARAFMNGPMTMTARMHVDAAADVVHVTLRGGSIGDYGGGWSAGQWNASSGDRVKPIQNVAGFSVDGAWYAKGDWAQDKNGLLGNKYQFRDVGTDQNIGAAVMGVPTAHARARRLLVEQSTEQYSPTDVITGTNVLNLVAIDDGRTLATWTNRGATFSSDGTKVLVSSTPVAAFMLAARQGAASRSGMNLRRPEEPAWLLVDAQSGATIAQAPPAVSAGDTWALSFDGERIATVQDNKLIVLSASGAGAAPTIGQPSASPEPSTPVLLPATFGVNAAAAFTPDGRWLVARAADSQVDVWDAATGTRLPFRLEAPMPAGTIQVREVQQAASSAGPWRPVEIISQIANAEVFIGCEDLVPANLREKVTACTRSPDRQRFVFSRWQPRRSLRDRLTSRNADAGAKVRHIGDAASGKTIVVLQDVSGVPETEYEGLFYWSPDGRFVVEDLSTSQSGSSGQTVRAWDAVTGQQLDLVSAGVADEVVWGFVPGTTLMASGNETGSRARIVDLATLRVIVELPTHPQTLTGSLQLSPLVTGALRPAMQGGMMNLATNGIVWMGLDSDGSLWIRKAGSSEELGSLRVIGNGDWLVSTPSGLFDGSPGGWQQLAWRAGDRTTVEPGEAFFYEFYQPGLLADLLGGRVPRVVRPIAERDRRQPTVTLTTTATAARMAAVTITVTVERGGASPSPGARDLRLFRNGVLVKAWRGDLALDADGNARVETQVPIVAGPNRFVAYAFNRDNIKSLDAVATITGSGPVRAGTVYILAIGVDRYANPAFNLRYAAADARAFGTELAARQRALGFARVELIMLRDEEATRANILLALERLAGTASSALPPEAPDALLALNRAEPEDSVVVYFAGHGIAVQDRFHLVPSDIAYQGPREAAAGALATILRHTISDLDLERAFQPVDAQHLLLVIDACDSGQALASDEGRFGPMNSRGLAQLAYEKGMSVLTASQAYQAALETARLGHGYLTYALVEEGLNGTSADTLPQNGEVTAAEWFTFAEGRVPQLQLEALTDAEKSGRSLRFDLSGVANGRGLQTPRVFMRRDGTEAPFIVVRLSSR